MNLDTFVTFFLIFTFNCVRQRRCEMSQLFASIVNSRAHLLFIYPTRASIRIRPTTLIIQTQSANSQIIFTYSGDYKWRLTNNLFVDSAMVNNLLKLVRDLYISLSAKFCRHYTRLGVRGTFSHYKRRKFKKARRNIIFLLRNRSVSRYLSVRLCALV